MSLHNALWFSWAALKGFRKPRGAEENMSAGRPQTDTPVFYAVYVCSTCVYHSGYIHRSIRLIIFRVYHGQPTHWWCEYTELLYISPWSTLRPIWRSIIWYRNDPLNWVMHCEFRDIHCHRALLCGSFPPSVSVLLTFNRPGHFITVTIRLYCMSSSNSPVSLYGTMKVGRTKVTLLPFLLLHIHGVVIKDISKEYNKWRILGFIILLIVFIVLRRVLPFH